MKILAVGDSFTYGDELVNRDFAWPGVLARMLNGSVINKGQPGGSNDCIVRNCLEHLATNDVDLVVIGWANPGRMEFADEKGYYDIWPGYSGKLAIESDRLWRADLVKYITLHHSSEAYYEKFLNQVLLMQGFLKSRNQKYVMCNTLQNEHYKRVTPERLMPLFNQVDTNSFVGFGTEGMVEWAYGFEKGPRGHFLDDGHKMVANKIYEHIRNLSWLS
jgi:hypothetical protein